MPHWTRCPRRVSRTDSPLDEYRGCSKDLPFTESRCVDRTTHSGGRARDAISRSKNRKFFGQSLPCRLVLALLAPPPMEAWHASILVVALAQEVPMSYRGRDAFQEIDNRTLFASCAKWLGIARGGYRAEELLDAVVRAATRGCLGGAMLMLSAVIVGAVGGAVSG